MPNRRLIIGVVGATKRPPNGVPDLAKAVGCEIAARGMVGLTGGRMPADGTPLDGMAVKEAAILGAAGLAMEELLVLSGSCQMGARRVWQRFPRRALEMRFCGVFTFTHP